jgi:hypothetical protein
MPINLHPPYSWLARFEVFIVFLLLSGAAIAQAASGAAAVASTSTSSSASALPHFVRFNGTTKDLNGTPLAGTVGITFALYAEQSGGAPLWLETQNVQADSNGRYNVLLGFTKPDGLPADLFTSEEARWVGVRVSGQAEQPRVLLVPVPYAMKAVDAESLGGRPASAYALVAPAVSAKSGAADKAAANATVAPGKTSAPPAGAVTGSGVANYIPIWTSASNLADSLIFQSGTKVGINTTTPGATLSVKGSGTFFANSNAQALEVTQSGGIGSGIIASTNSTGGVGIQGTSSSTANSVLGGIGVVGFSSNPSGTGVQGSSSNIGVTGNGGGVGGTTGIGVKGNGDQYGVYGSAVDALFPAFQVGVYGTTASASGTAYGVEGNATATTGAAVGVMGNSSGPSGYGVYGSSPNVGLFGVGNYGVDAHGALAGVKGVATVTGGLAGLFQGGPILVGGNGNNALLGDPGCGSGFAAIGFTTGGLSGCTNYALLGGTKGDTYVNAGGTASIHFRSNNNELVTISNDGNVDVIGQNGGGNLTVAGKVTSSNVIAQASASNSVGLNCTGTLSSPNSSCLVPNMTLTKTTANPSVLVMVNIGGVVADSCSTANFYLVVDNKIVALDSVSFNSNNSASGFEASNVTIVSLQNLAAGSHTFQVQQATDQANASCSTFRLETSVSNGDGGMGSLRSLIVREF